MTSGDHIEYSRQALADAAKVPALHSSPKGPPVREFRSRAARDLACILDFNTSVVSWVPAATGLPAAAHDHIADFEMLDEGGVRWLLDAPDRLLPVAVDKIGDAAKLLGYRYRLVAHGEIYDGFRLRNARDLLRYRGHNVPLGDRVRLLGALDEEGPLSFVDCMRVIRETQPVAAIASLILQGLLEVELDDALIGPETMVRRIKG